MTLRGRFDRRGFGTAGDVAMAAAVRRGASEGEATEAGVTDDGLALVLAGRGMAGAVAGFGSLAAGRGSTGGCGAAGGAVTWGLLGLLEPFEALSPESGASLGALTIV